MRKRTAGNEYSFQTRVVHTGNDIDSETGAFRALLQWSVCLGENDERQYLDPEASHNGFFRSSVGIQDAEDTIKNLRQVLEKVGLVE